MKKSESKYNGRRLASHIPPKFFYLANLNKHQIANESGKTRALNDTAIADEREQI